MNSSYLNSENELFIRIADGDEAAFTQCYADYGRMLMPFLIRLTGSRDSAEEIVQEVFLKVWLHRDRLAAVDQPKSWLFRVAANTGRNWLKKQMMIEQRLRLQQQPAVHEPQSDQVDLRKVAIIVRDTIQGFPPQRKLIYQLSREEGMKPSEIAARLKLSVSTVKNTLLSALKTIRENIEAAGLLGILIIFFIKT